MPSASRKPGRKQRFDDLVGKLKKIAVDLGPGQKLPEVSELRDAMGVSVTTLTSALDELEACRMIVRRRGTGIFSSADVGKRVVSLVCDPLFFRDAGGSPFWDMLIDQARQRAQTCNELLDMQFLSIDGLDVNLPMGLQDGVLAGRLSGVIMIGTCPLGAEWIEKCGVPVAAFAGPSSHQVQIDTRRLIADGVRSLAARGCKRIALVVEDTRLLRHSEVTDYIRDRSGAFQAALTENQLSFIPELVWQPNIPREDGRPAVGGGQGIGYAAGQMLLGMPAESRPDGVLFTNDLLTLGFLSAARQHGVEIGRDLLVATHSNTGSALLIGWEERLITIKIDPAEIATLLFESLERLMDGDRAVPFISWASTAMSVGSEVRRLTNPGHN